MVGIGKALSPFELSGVHSGKVKNYTLKEFLGNWWVLFFYPKDFTFVCPTEVMGFHKQVEEFKSEGAAIAGVSCDSVETHKAWAEELGGLSFPLLSDDGHRLSESLGVFHEAEKAPARATFLIDPQGVVQYACVTHRNVGRSVQETLRVLKALKTGQMCPADWKPGQETFDTSNQY